MKCHACRHGLNCHSGFAGACRVIRSDNSVCNCKGGPYLSPRKRRRIKRRSERRYTERVALEWGCVPGAGEFSIPLRKRLFALMTGTVPPDVRICFWYNPDHEGAFERFLQRSSREYFLYRWLRPYLPVSDREMIEPRYTETQYVGRRWGWQWAGLRLEAWLYLPQGAPDRDYHGADMRRALDTIRVDGLIWARSFGFIR